VALTNQVVVVTGGARGMGRAFVEGFLDAGARVAALDLSWEPSGASNDQDDSYRRAMEARDDVLTLTADITREEQVREAYAATLRKFGTVDVLVNNAGMLQRNLFPPGGPITILETTNDDFRKMYDVNVFGTLTVTRYFIQPMIERRKGSIFSVVSNGTLLVHNGSTYVLLRPDSREQPYMSSKSALVNVMCYLADEVRAHNIAVNTFVPGHTRSTGFDEWREARIHAKGSGGRVPVGPRHVVPLALFLAQQDAQGGNTGKVWEALVWNQEHGHGGYDAWLAPDQNPTP
jgi:NAD(P)-dependent dehydrogenase (short-subunit alcohol dehydrogenase family)